MKTIFIPISFLCMFVAACSSTPPVVPSAENIKVSRDIPDEDCIELGLVEGRTIGTKGTFEEALEDLKKDAAFKGANFVQIEKTGAMGTSVRGTAFLCN